jgi:hypothetical protein
MHLVHYTILGFCKKLAELYFIHLQLQSPHPGFVIATLGPGERPILSQEIEGWARLPIFTKYSQWNISATNDLIFQKI